MAALVCARTDQSSVGRWEMKRRSSSFRNDGILGGEKGDGRVGGEEGPGLAAAEDGDVKWRLSPSSE